MIQLTNYLVGFKQQLITHHKWQKI